MLNNAAQTAPEAPQTPYNPNHMRIDYEATTTFQAFHASDAEIRGVRGPIGSGKSVGCVMEVLAKAMQQTPNRAGLRKTRWAIIRATFPELKSTTIKTWQDWIPDNICPLKMNNSPIDGLLTLPLPDGTVVMCEVLFVALDKPKDLSKLLSLELTGAWINEAKELPKSVLDGVQSRCGRYPAKRDSDLTWSGVIMDTNSPNQGHWYAELEQNPPQGFAMFRQPPALIRHSKSDYTPNPLAENAQHQPKGYKYWLDIVHGKDENWIRAYVLNEFATVSAGKPVFGDHFSQTYHVSQNKLWPLKDQTIFIGFDFGLTPAAVFAQVAPTGQLRILDSIVAKRMGFKGFLADAVMPLIAEKYATMPRIYIGDPSGVRASDTNERSCYDEARDLGIRIIPAVTNNIEPRLEAVRFFMTRNVGKGEAGLLVSNHLNEIVDALACDYQYARLQVSGEERYRDKPEKNAASHPMDALQYVCLQIRRAIHTAARPAPPPSSTVSAADSMTGY
jgi:hypothetical protein